MQLSATDRERQLQMQLEAQKSVGLKLADEFAQSTDELHHERLTLEARCSALAHDLGAAQDQLDRIRSVRQEEKRQLERCLDERDAAKAEALQQAGIAQKTVSILEQRVANLLAQGESEHSRHCQAVAGLYKLASVTILNADESLQSAVSFNHALDIEQAERALDEVGRALQIATKVIKNLKGLSNGLLETVHLCSGPNGRHDALRPEALSRLNRPASHPSSLRTELMSEAHHL